MKIPYLPLDLFGESRTALLDAVRRVGMSPELVPGPRTAAFEEALRADVGAVDVIACGGGFPPVLRALGVRAGDEVVVPAFGGAALASACVHLDAVPVFADVDPWTLVVDPVEVDKAVTGRTRVIAAAHVFAVMADMPALRRIAADYEVRLLEDASSAHGGVLGGRPAGTWGDVGMFSFAWSEVCGMPGEGGAVVTSDPGLGRAVRALFAPGGPCAGSRFDEVMAAFQLHRMPLWPRLRDRRARIAEYYTGRFSGLTGVRPAPSAGGFHAVYAVFAERRDALREHLATRGIGTHVHHPVPLPRHPAFVALATPGRDWPAAERATAHHLALPLHHRLTDAQAEQVADEVCRFAGRT
ncbi:DegT/DnrJ/EryC1/StrS family aminotransferase [Actinosynnema sp. NPDC020468]|uniref:DegT/DnrJ/EryC1/StrS family aminotransferase n=1 Tax=Actinosynnema sp. NPDC020468 TaxID=3154488 RepID=UPI0033C464AE